GPETQEAPGTSFRGLPGGPGRSVQGRDRGGVEDVGRPVEGRQVDGVTDEADGAVGVQGVEAGGVDRADLVPAHAGRAVLGGLVAAVAHHVRVPAVDPALVVVPVAGAVVVGVEALLGAHERV